MHAQSGMDLKTLVEHFPDHSIQTNSLTEPSSPRRSHSISARSWLSQIKPGFFFYLKTTYSEHIWWSLQTILLLLCGFMGFAYVLKCIAHHSQTVLGKILTNTCQLLWSQNLLRIPDFHIEKKSWHGQTLLGVCRHQQLTPWKGWLRDTNWRNRMSWKVSHKGF